MMGRNQLAEIGLLSEPRSWQTTDWSDWRANTSVGLLKYICLRFILCRAPKGFAGTKRLLARLIKSRQQASESELANKWLNRNHAAAPSAASKPPRWRPIGRQ